jgi:two-component system sensor histidine kinase YesM
MSLAVATVKRAALGEFGARIEDSGSGNDEIGLIIGQFNNLLELLQETVAHLIEQEGQRRDAQLESLRYQINPHFIYNAMYLVQLSVEEAGLWKLSDAVSCFADILRYNVSGAMYATFAEEISHIRAYMRFVNSFRGEPIELAVSCSEQLASRPFLRFIFQPLVENAVKYGGAGLRHIAMEIGEDGKCCFADIRNDGALMDRAEAEQLAAAMRLLAGDSQGAAPGGHVGLRNIVRRLKLFYGPGAELRLANDGQFCVHIAFPKEAGNIQKGGAIYSGGYLYHGH